MRLPRLAIAAALLSCPLSASAAPPPTAPPASSPASAPSATATDLARLLVPKEMWTQGLEQLSSNVQMRLEGHPGAKLEYPKDLPARVRSEVEGALPYEELVAMHARQLDASYTAPELNELLAFHKTPTGKKWLQSQPQNFERVGAETQKRMDQKLPEIMNKLGKLAEKPAGGAPPSPHGAAPKKK